MVAAAERLAAAGPLALVADDVHWADDESLDALRAVAIRTGALGILVLTAARPHPTSVSLRRLEEATAREGVGLVPSALAPSDLAALVTTRFGSAPGDNLASLLAGTGGNPFLAVELLAGLADEGRIVVRHGTLDLDRGTEMPEDLGTRLARRTLFAVPDAELLLRAAAVLPGGCSVEELAALLDQPLTEVLATTLAAVEAGVLADTGAALGVPARPAAAGSARRDAGVDRAQPPPPGGRRADPQGRRPGEDHRVPAGRLRPQRPRRPRALGHRRPRRDRPQPRGGGRSAGVGARGDGTR